jgi:hypothetical protein
MTKISYEVVEHDGGWAYKVGATFSETFDTREQAHQAAEAAASEQEANDETTDIEYEDADGKWHLETSAGDDRPEADVKD